MAHKADIEKWVDLIEAGTRYKEDYGNSKNWPTYRNYGRGIFSGYNSTASGILPYNVTYAMGRTLVPNIYFRNPYITTSSRYKPGLALQAKLLEAVDNWLIQELAIKQAFKTAVMDCYYTNRGIIKVGYDSLAGSIDTGRSIHAKLRDILKPDNSVYNTGKKKGEKVEYNVNVKPGMPWAIRVMPDYFIVPFGVRSLDECPWVDHVVIRPTKDVKDDPVYKNTADLEGSHVSQLNKKYHNNKFFQDLMKDVDLCEIHEIRDFKKGEIKTFVPGHDKWIREPQEDKLQLEGLPFVDFTFNEDTEYYWGPSDVQIIEPQQLEVNEARTQAMYHRRVALIKFLIEEGRMDDSEVDKMLSENVAPACFVKGAPREVVSLLQPHMPQDINQWTEIIRSDVRELLGHSKQQMGELPPGRRTAKEIDVVQRAHDIRMDERRDIVADALGKLVRKINQVIFDRWDQTQVAQVVGVDGAKYWVEYDKKNIAGEYDIKVDVESMTPMTKAAKKRDILQVIQAVGKNPRANIDVLMRMLLREYEWMDAMSVLPEAVETQQQPMGAQDWMGQQQGLMNNPSQLAERAQGNAQLMGNVL